MTCLYQKTGAGARVWWTLCSVGGWNQRKKEGEKNIETGGREIIERGPDIPGQSSQLTMPLSVSCLPTTSTSLDHLSIYILATFNVINVCGGCNISTSWPSWSTFDHLSNVQKGWGPGQSSWRSSPAWHSLIASILVSKKQKQQMKVNNGTCTGCCVKGSPLKSMENLG